MTTGYLTSTDLINLKIMSDSNRIETSKISDLIESDMISIKKQEMIEGVNYFNADHDILEYERKYYRDNLLVVNKVKANNTIPHPFHRNLVNEKTTYLTGNPITIGITGEDRKEKDAIAYRTSLMNFLDERFDDLVSDWVEGASNKGIEWVHFYIDKNGKLNFLIVPAEQIIGVYDPQYEDKLQMVVRYYLYDIITEKGSVLRRYKVELWTEENVEYWVQLEDESFVIDVFYQTNPAPHWIEFNTSDPSKIESHSWGRVPFIPLWNNSKMTNDLKPIKLLIDAYDKVKSGWCNDIEDFSELIYVVKGWQNLSQEGQSGMTELAMFIKNTKEDGAIAVEPEGDVTAIRAEIPVEAKDKFLDITGREIIYFGEGSDVTADLLSKSHAPSGVALQFLYARLDMKANRIARKLKTALKDFVWFVTQHINRTENKKFDSGMITFTINKNQIFNETERVQMLVSSGDMISQETKLENHPLIDSVQSEMERLKREAELKPKVEIKQPSDINPKDMMQ